MKRTFINYKFLSFCAYLSFFASAFLFSNSAIAQGGPGPTFTPCGVNGITFTQQMGIGSNNKMMLGGFGTNDGAICWNCYSDSLNYGRSKAFNMPAGGFVAGSPTPHWSSRIFQDIPKGMFRIQNGQQSVCYDSIAWDRGIALDKNGNVGIGTDPMQTYKLSVNGTVIAKNEVRVTLLGVPWPDYVFASDYTLKPLLILEQEIDSLGHLPEMPSALEVETDGLSLTGVSTVLVKKVEELTLYTIEQQKQIDELRKQNEELKKLVLRIIEEK